MSETVLKNGFYPALGTPTTPTGTLVKDSFNNQIELMIEAGAKGVLCMGSMGRMATIQDRVYPEVAKQCSIVVGKRVPVMIGVMDCSVSRVLDRIEVLGNIQIEGVVATAPFYSKADAAEITNFFKMLAKRSKYPVFIYDLPSVTQSPITLQIVQTLMEETNIHGIKTANLAMIQEIHRNNMVRENFSVLYSGLDLFDVALWSGVSKNLDGMFTCTPRNSKRMYKKMGQDREATAGSLNNILKLRNVMIKENVFSSYSYVMELIGCPGNYHPDFDIPASEKLKKELLNCMKEIGEI